MSDLTKGAAAEIARVDVKVLSQSNPAPGLLRLARVAVQTVPEIGDLFKQARAEGRPAEWLKEKLVPELQKCFPEESVEQEATYLADEYSQIGDSILLVSAETGRALARITEDDLYQPAPVPRESGNMAMPAKRLRPEIEGFIVQWSFDQGRERDVVEKLLDRLPPQTELLRAEGDGRLLMASRAGRRLMATQVQNALPTLLESSTGLARGFLDFFPLGKPGEGGFDCIKDLKTFGNTRHLLQDPLARNVRFDTRQSILSSTATSWVRGFAWYLVEEAVKQRRTKSSLVMEALMGRTSGLWLATPNAARRIQGQARVLVLPATGMAVEVAIYLTEPAGYLEVDPNGYWCRTKEAHDKWTVETEVAANLWVDWSKLYAVELTDIPMTGVSVEVV